MALLVSVYFRKIVQIAFALEKKEKKTKLINDLWDAKAGESL